LGRCVTCDSLLNPVAVAVYLAAGKPDLARAAADEADATGTAFGSRSWLGTADRARAMILAVDGSLGPAESVAARSVTTFERLGQPYDQARSLALLGAIRRRAGRERISATEAAQRAKSIFETLGAAKAPDPLDLILASAPSH
jgi:hypothetical protein